MIKKEDILVHIYKTHTVEPLLAHTYRWMAQAMGCQRLWVTRGQFRSKFGFIAANLKKYGLRGVQLYYTLFNTDTLGTVKCLLINWEKLTTNVSYFEKIFIFNGPASRLLST